MKIRKGNNTEPIKNNQENDNVVIDGLMTAEDLVNIGKKAGMNTIEQLRLMYPKNENYEKFELEKINEENLTKELRRAGKQNDEKINSIYSNQIAKEEIRKTKNEITRLNEEYQNTKNKRIMEEKDEQIRMLQEKLNKLNKIE